MRKFLILFLFLGFFSTELKSKICLVSFDGSGYFDMWRDTLQFAKAQDIHFTYFVSAPYFITEEDCKDHPYWAPTELKKDPYCKIMKAEDREGVLERMQYLLNAFHDGHEIASHLCGHYDGSKWSYGQWTKEMDFFDWAMAKHLYEVENPPPRFKIDLNITGIRAPYLGVNKDYFRAVKEHGYRYDSSMGSLDNPMRAGFPEIPIHRVHLVGYGEERAFLPFDEEFNRVVRPTIPFLDEQSEADTVEQEENMFFDLFCTAYNRTDDITPSGQLFPVQICLHFFHFHGQPYYNAMKKFVVWAKSKGAVFMTYQEYEDKVGWISTPTPNPTDVSYNHDMK